MKMSGQLKAPAAKSPVCAEREAGWAEQPVWTFWEGKICSLCRDIPAGNPFTMPTEVPRRLNN